MYVTLKNDFHRTEVRVRVATLPCLLSVSQSRRVDRALCGMDDCSCGTIVGDQDVEVDVVFGVGDVAFKLWPLRDARYMEESR